MDLVLRQDVSSNASTCHVRASAPLSMSRRDRVSGWSASSDLNRPPSSSADRVGLMRRLRLGVTAADI
jgi:hypothetical protein